MPNSKPAHVKLRGTDLKSTDYPVSGQPDPDDDAVIRTYDFNTAGQRDAAETILRYWEEDLGNFSAMADKAGWSRAHIRNVFEEYFEPVETEVDVDPSVVGGEEEPSPNDLSEQAMQIYRQGYRDGYADGLEDGRAGDGNPADQ